MTSYTVIIKYLDGNNSGKCRFDVEAANEDEAEEKALDEWAETIPGDEVVSVKVKKQKGRHR